MGFLQTITGRVITGLITLGVIVGAISWWRMDPATRQMLLDGVGKISLWFGVMLLLPWVGFYLIGRVARMESNLAGAVLVLAFTVVDLCLLAGLFEWQLLRAVYWKYLFVGGLFAAAYNLFTCDWIAEKVN